MRECEQIAALFSLRYPYFKHLLQLNQRRWTKQA